MLVATWFDATVLGVLGLLIGSFLNVVIYRLPVMLEAQWKAECAEMTGKETASAEKFNLAVPRSRCLKCGHQIQWYENIPVFSYLFLRGKCSNCKTPISLRYPLVELATAALFIYCGWKWGATPAALVWCGFGATMLALGCIDWDTTLLPDDITLPLLWAGLLFNLFGTFAPLQEAVIGAAAGYLVLWTINAAFRLIRGIDGMGYGDFKMTAAVGAFVGWKYLFLVILLSSCVGLVFGALQMIAARRGWDAMFRFHFGPYIAIAGVAALLCGPAILAYLPALRPF